MNQQHIDALREAIKLSPDNILIRIMLIDAHLALLQYPLAETVCKESLNLFPNNNPLKLKLAHIFLHLQKYSAALIILDEITTDNTNTEQTAQAYLLAAKLYFEQNKLSDAQEHYNQATQLHPSLAEPNFEKALHDKIIQSGAALTEKSTTATDSTSNTDAPPPFEIERPKISFKDVGGMDTIKQDIALKVIHPLQNPEIYKAFGKKIGGGILLYGPPGVGKTMLARATAGEINARFIAVGINDVLDMWLGNSEKNLHRIFQEARKNTPCVLFFDEIDALGASRTDMRNNSARFLINQFLDELDGVKNSNDGILILGATNCPWYVDSAFRRPGRFDRILFIPPPDLPARSEILRLLLQNKPNEYIDIQQIAKETPNYSGADLTAVVELAIEAKIPQSIQQGKVIPISQTDLLNAIKQHRATTTEWLNTAKNYALYSNESGLYDDILKYLQQQK